MKRLTMVLLLLAWIALTGQPATAERECYSREWNTEIMDCCDYSCDLVGCTAYCDYQTCEMWGGEWFCVDNRSI